MPSLRPTQDKSAFLCLWQRLLHTPPVPPLTPQPQKYRRRKVSPNYLDDFPPPFFLLLSCLLCVAFVTYHAYLLISQLSAFDTDKLCEINSVTSTREQCPYKYSNIERNETNIVRCVYDTNYGPVYGPPETVQVKEEFKNQTFVNSLGYFAAVVSLCIHIPFIVFFLKHCCTGGDGSPPLFTILLCTCPIFHHCIFQNLYNFVCQL